MSNEQQQQEHATESEEQVTEAVVETSESNLESTETEQNADNETEEYDALVDRFDEAISSTEAPETAPTEQPQQTEQPNAPHDQEPGQQGQEHYQPSDTRIDVMYQKFEEDLRAKASQDFDTAVSTVKEASPAFQALPDRYVRGILEQEVRDDPKLLRAFQNRHMDRKAWDDIVVAKGKHMAKNLGALPDKAATTGQAALRASVNSQSGNSSSSQFSASDISNMSDSEFLRRQENGDFG